MVVTVRIRINIMHLVEDHGERQDERLVDARVDSDGVRVLPHQRAPQGGLHADLRNHGAAGVGHGHRVAVVASVNDEVGRPLAGGAAVEEHVDRGRADREERRLVHGDEEKVRLPRAPGPERLPPPAHAEQGRGLLDGEQGAARGGVEEEQGAQAAVAEVGGFHLHHGRAGAGVRDVEPAPSRGVRRRHRERPRLARVEPRVCRRRLVPQPRHLRGSTRCRCWYRETEDGPYAKGLLW